VREQKKGVWLGVLEEKKNIDLTQLCHLIICFYPFMNLTITLKLLWYSNLTFTNIVKLKIETTILGSLLLAFLVVYQLSNQSKKYRYFFVSYKHYNCNMTVISSKNKISIYLVHMQTLTCSE
jgi:hypothetical protein